MDNKRFYDWLNLQLEEQTEFEEVLTPNPEQKLVILPNPDKKRTQTLKGRSVVCEDCGLTVPDVKRRYQRSKAKTWIEWCITCQRHRSPDTGRFDHIEPFSRNKRWSKPAVDDKESNGTDQDDD